MSFLKKRGIKEGQKVKEQSDQRAKYADGLISYSKRVDAALQNQYAENGWTKLLTEAMQQKNRREA